MTHPHSKGLTETPMALVLGAGQGTRMNSQLPKVAHLILQRPMLAWVIDALEESGVEDIAIVSAPTHEIVHNLVQEIQERKKNLHMKIAFQEKPLGTAHAVSSGIPTLKEDFHASSQRIVLVVLGDTPAISADSLKNLLNFHFEKHFDLTLLAFKAKDPSGYGRVLLGQDSLTISAIREHKECSPEELKINLCNSGIMCARFEVFEKFLPLIKNQNSKQEFYLTDLPVLVSQAGLKAGAFITENELEFSGVNTQEQLTQLQNFLIHKGK